MKKKSFIAFLLGASLLFTPSCTNLDEDIYDKLPAESFGNTEIEINALLGTVYNTLKNYFNANYTALDDMGGSMSMKPTRKGGDWYDGGQYREMYMHDYTAQTSCIRGAWSTASSNIGKCNATYDVINNSELLSEADKTMKLAEIRGVRAFWIYKMMDYWGNIPLVTDYSDKELPSCRPRQEVYSWLVSEVKDIADKLPAREGNYGKFTQGAAYSLLAVLYLNAEAWGVTCDGNAYQEVINACDKVLGMGYILEPDWKDNFSISNEDSQEAILAAVYDEADTSNTNQLHFNTLHYKDNIVFGANFSAWNGMCAQPDYAKLYSEDDPRFDLSFMHGISYDPSTGEPIITAHNFVLDHTIEVSILPGTERDGTPWGDVNQHDGVRTLKWPYTSSMTSAMGHDFHIFRLAEVYLMKAEAILRNGGSGAEAAKYVNAIRERAFGDSDHNYATVTLADVQLERRLEFAWELKSRQDDIRFGCYDTGMWSSSNCPRKTGDHLKLYPVSFTAWQTNPNLTQNPGYPAFN